MELKFSLLFKSWSGEWTLIREISPEFHFEGLATFEALSANTYLLRETGLLYQASKPAMTANRSWHWELVGENQLKISYDEKPPRLYHALNMQFDEEQGGWTGQGLHVCAPDEYRGSYHLSGDKLESVQDVSGPKKSYRVHSVFKRIVS